VPVVIATVTARPFAEEIIALGTLRARESIDVTSHVSEKVARIHFTDGETVRKGQVLVELVHAEELSRLDRERAELDRERAELARVETLARGDIATPSELDTQRTRVHTAHAALRTIEAQLGDRLVRAPFTGVVGLRKVSPGSLVTPSTIITTLDAIDTLYADLPVPERFLGQLARGQRVTLQNDAYPDETFSGEVLAIEGRVDPTTRAITVRARIDNPEARLRPGMLVRAVLAVGERTSASVPETALVQRSSRAFVYSLEPGQGTSPPTVRQVEIKVGRRQPGWVEVLAGLQGGEHVVSEGTHRVQPGAKVTVRE
jgi:membrane fusion protein (multidrug efflux system)